MKQTMARWIGRMLAAVLLLSSLSASKSEAADTGYSIAINIAANVVTVYYNGVPVRAMICSTGEATPQSGTYTSSTKQRWGYLFGNVSGQYAYRITGHILFHSVPYTVHGDPSSLEEGQFDLLGTAASMGCVRMMVADVKWVYENCPSGTPVTFYSDAAVPSPLGMPFFAGTGYFPETMQRWDPTDPTEGNPWNAFRGAAFDAAYYLEHYPDLQGSYAWTEDSLWLHWVTFGIREGRSGSALMEMYRQARPDVAAQYASNMYAFVAALNQAAAQGKIGR